MSCSFRLIPDCLLKQSDQRKETQVRLSGHSIKAPPIDGAGRSAEDFDGADGRVVHRRAERDDQLTIRDLHVVKLSHQRLVLPARRHEEVKIRDPQLSVYRHVEDPLARLVPERLCCLNCNAGKLRSTNRSSAYCGHLLDHQRKLEV